MKHPVRRRLLRLGFHLLRGLSRALPLRVAQAIGTMIGYFAYAALRPYRELTKTHLRQAFGPQLSADTCRRISRRAFVNLGKTIMEWFVIDRLTPSQIQRIVTVQGVEHLQRALALGRGVIGVSAHFGNWEMLPIAIARLGIVEGGVLARQLRYPEYQEFLWGMRQRKGVMTYERGSLREVAHVLRQNKIIGILPDQDTDSLDGVFVDFFDQPAYTPVGPAALAMLTGAPILPCFVVRQGWKFRIVIEEPVTVARTGDRIRDLAALTQAWSRIVESYIRCYPDHWAWMHRRWKTQPTAAATETSTWNGGEPPAVRPAHRQASMVAALLALSWIVGITSGCGKSKSATSEQAAPDTAVTQEMDGFTMAGYAPDGTKRWDLQGQGATAVGNVVTVQQPSATGYDVAEPGATPKPSPALMMASTPAAAPSNAPRTAYLTASLAHVQQDTRRMRLEDQVTVHTSDGLWLFSPEMYWNPDERLMTTDSPVRIETDHMLLRGRGATARTALSQAQVLRDVELVLNPTSEQRPAGPNGEHHVHITCDGPLSFDYEHNMVTFEEHVVVNDPQGELYSDKLVAYLDNTTRTIRYAEATGRVRIVQHGNTATGERAVYEPTRGKITLLGAPSLLIQQDGSTGGEWLGDLPGKNKDKKPAVKPGANAEDTASVVAAEQSALRDARRAGRLPNAPENASPTAGASR